MTLSIADARKLFSQFADAYIKTEPWASCYNSAALHLIAMKDGIPLTDEKTDKTTGCYFSVFYWKPERNTALTVPALFGGVRVEATFLKETRKERLRSGRTVGAVSA